MWHQTQGLIVLLSFNSVSLIHFRAWKGRWWYLQQRSRKAKKLGWGHTAGETALVMNLGHLLPCSPPHRERNGQSPEMRTLPMEILNSTFLTKAKISNVAEIKKPLPCSPAWGLSQNHFRGEWQCCDGQLNTWYFFKKFAQTFGGTAQTGRGRGRTRAHPAQPVLES